ncbi:MAG: hypothetical protein U0787_17240 [Polyangia bacterium]
MALLVLFRLVARRFGSTVALRTLLLLLFFPYSLYLSSFHTEPLFLCLVVCSFFFAEQKSFGKAAFCGLRKCHAQRRRACVDWDLRCVPGLDPFQSAQAWL